MVGDHFKDPYDWLPSAVCKAQPSGRVWSLELGPAPLSTPRCYFKSNSTPQQVTSRKREVSSRHTAHSAPGTHPRPLMKASFILCPGVWKFLLDSHPSLCSTLVILPQPDTWPSCCGEVSALWVLMLPVLVGFAAGCIRVLAEPSSGFLGASPVCMVWACRNKLKLGRDLGASRASGTDLVKHLQSLSSHSEDFT